MYYGIRFQGFGKGCKTLPLNAMAQVAVEEKTNPLCMIEQYFNTYHTNLAPNPRPPSGHGRARASTGHKRSSLGAGAKILAKLRDGGGRRLRRNPD